MVKGSDPGSGQASHLAVAAVVLVLIFAAMTMVRPLLNPEVPQQSNLPPLFQALKAR